jgi:hypothetical protein
VLALTHDADKCAVRPQFISFRQVPCTFEGKLRAYLRALSRSLKTRRLLCQQQLQANMESTPGPAPKMNDGVSRPDSQFVFVTDHDRGYIRSRLMRDSWRGRSERNSQKPVKKRKILPARSFTASREENAGSSSRKSRAEEQQALDHHAAADPAALTSLRTSLRISRMRNSRKIIDFQGPSNNPYDVSPVFK